MKESRSAELSPRDFLHGACAEEAADTFKAIDSGNPTRVQRLAAKKACLSCVQYDLCKERQGEIASLLQAEGAVRPMIAGDVVIVGEGLTLTFKEAQEASLSTEQQEQTALEKDIQNGLRFLVHHANGTGKTADELIEHFFAPEAVTLSNETITLLQALQAQYRNYVAQNNIESEEQKIGNFLFTNTIGDMNMGLSAKTLPESVAFLNANRRRQIGYDEALTSVGGELHGLFSSLLDQESDEKIAPIEDQKPEVESDDSKQQAKVIKQTSESRQAGGDDAAPASEKDSNEIPDFNILKKVKKLGLLTPEQEVDLSKQIEAGLFAQAILDRAVVSENANTSSQEELEEIAKEGRQAFNEFVEKNIRLTVVHANRAEAHPGSLTREDFMQEGAIGLMNAVKKFDYKRGFRFSTSATWWIQDSVQRSLLDNGPMRLPGYIAEAISHVRRVRSAFYSDNGQYPTINELAHLTKKDPRLIKQAMEIINRRVDSLDMPLSSDDSGGTPKDVIPEGRDGHFTDDIIEKEDNRMRIEQLMQGLTQQEQRIVSSYFGLDGEKPKVHKDIGEMLGVTEWISRAGLRRALKKVREVAETDRLD